VELALQSVYRLVHWLGRTVRVSWTVHLAVAAALVLAYAQSGPSRLPYSLKAAVLCIAAVMFTPYVLAWDLCILSVAAAFLVRDGLSRGFLPGERVVMLLCWAGLFLPDDPDRTADLCCPSPPCCSTDRRRPQARSSAGTNTKGFSCEPCPRGLPQPGVGKASFAEACHLASYVRVQVFASAHLKTKSQSVESCR